MHTRLAVMVLLLAIAVGAAILSPGVTRADEGWDITRFDIALDIQPDGSIEVVEQIDADFGALTKHGIFRDFVVAQPCDEFSPSGTTGDAGFSDVPAFAVDCPSGSDRVYDIDIHEVTSNGASIPWEDMHQGGVMRLRIGDPDRTVRGLQEYRLVYTLRDAMNAFTDHDELYWNVTGLWPVSMTDVEIVVRLPDGAQVTATCFEGYGGFTAQCEHSASGATATFRASRELFPNEQVTIVAGWQKGIVDVGPPVVKDRVSIDDFFTFDTIEFALAGAAGVLGLGLLATAWWRFGRDRSYTTVHYLTGDTTEQTRPLGADDHVVVEYLPPEDLRPAQMGVLLDERADSLDVTATIVDLAVRGYLSIVEIPKKGWFGKRDWELKKGAGKEGDTLLPYEEKLWDALFKNRDTVRVSTLKNTFYTTVNSVKKSLYGDAVKAGWFTRNPETMRGLWLGIGVAVVVTGVVLCVGAAYLFARPVIFVPVVVAGLLLMLFSRSMSRRTARGSEATRRVLGFREYVATAETRLHEFNEQQNIFARYLPYAMVFGCVEKWAEAFSKIGVNVAAQTSGWYAGAHAFNAASFSSDMHSFSSSVSSNISSTPGSSGGSGFSGGSSGGGGGGGGGGSW